MYKIKKLIYSWWYGIKIESGYLYQRIKFTNLVAFEVYHSYLLDEGWEKITEIQTDISYYFCWYRKKR